RLSKIAPGDFVEPEDFIARLGALVPKPGAHLTRYHGVFAPASPDRARVVPRPGSPLPTGPVSVATQRPPIGNGVSPGRNGLDGYSRSTSRSVGAVAGSCG